MPIGLVPPSAVVAMAKVLDYGNRKYTKHNWLEGAEWQVYYDAAQRHLLAWWGGETLDPDSGLPHLAHAMACMAILLEYQSLCPELDNRLKGAAPWEPYSEIASAPNCAETAPDDKTSSTT